MIRTLLVLLFLPLVGVSQNQYWAQQYGAQSSLLGGAVIATVNDNGAIYYNPARLAVIENNHLSISANAYGFEYGSLRNAAGDGLDLNTFQTNIYPQIISGMIKLKNTDRWKLGYGILTRFNNRLKFSFDMDMFTELVSTSPGEEYFTGNFTYELANIEQWGAIATGFKVTDNFSVGLSQFVSYLHNDSRIEINRRADAVVDSTGFSIERLLEENSVIDHRALLYKLGFLYRKNGHRFGLTVTTPSIQLFGRAKVSRTDLGFNMNRILEAPTEIFNTYPSFAMEEENRILKANYRLPWSFALGYGYVFDGGAKLVFTAEAFMPIKRFTVFLYDEPTAVRPTETYDGFTVDSFLYKTNQLRWVLNVAIGLEHPINERFSMLASFRTDFNSTDFDSQRNISASINTTFWNYYHFTLGATWKRENSQLAFGFNYSLGESRPRRQPLSFSEPLDPETLFGQTDDTFTSVVHGLSAIVGYTYYLRK